MPAPTRPDYMVDQWILKILLFPLAVLYGLGVSIRNSLYHSGLLKGVSFSLPVISIGNLSVGGTGKTPHTEYLIRLLRDHLRLAVLSRGYRRKTTGYLEVATQNDALQVGDEPLQFKRKYPDVLVVVAESRSLAIPLLLRSNPETQVVIMDDGFQHREVTPGLNILLTEYNRLYTRDWLLPVGRLREWRDSAGRADMIIVTKCPAVIPSEEMESIINEVKQNAQQQVFFSKYIYGHPYRMYGLPGRLELNDDLDVLLVVAIAGTEYLLEYVDSICGEVKMLEYQDHHSFTNFDIGNIELYFKNMSADRKNIILTTEKDAVRLDVHRELLNSLSLPIYILPVAVQFEDPNTFDNTIKEWLLNFKQ
ncbi:MAG: tetraacyldisaccharide 4'-kinase [Saprospiraceae bacterium]